MNKHVYYGVKNDNSSNIILTIQQYLMECESEKPVWQPSFLKCPSNNLDRKILSRPLCLGSHIWYSNPIKRGILLCLHNNIMLSKYIWKPQQINSKQCPPLGWSTHRTFQWTCPCLSPMSLRTEKERKRLRSQHISPIMYRI